MSSPYIRIISTAVLPHPAFNFSELPESELRFETSLSQVLLVGVCFGALLSLPFLIYLWFHMRATPLRAGVVGKMELEEDESDDDAEISVHQRQITLKTEVDAALAEVAAAVIAAAPVVAVNEPAAAPVDAAALAAALNAIVPPDVAPAAGANTPATPVVLPQVPQPRNREYTNACRKLGKRIGQEIRIQLGYPVYNRANEIIASQRVYSELDNYRDVRHSQRIDAHARAVKHVFLPTDSEIEMNADLNSHEMARVLHERYAVQYVPNVDHTILPVWLAGYLYGWVPSRVDF